MGKKLVVLFPGAGYHSDKPLLYYTKKIAKRYDYTIVELSFELSEAASAIKGDREKTRMALDTAFAQACGKLGDIAFGRYDRVNFVGKSIGTAVMRPIRTRNMPKYPKTSRNPVTSWRILAILLAIMA